MSSTKLSAKIKGIFLKSEEFNNQTLYHFIFPHVYHNDKHKMHSYNVLNDFNKKIEAQVNEQKLNEISNSHNVNSIKLKTPIYQDFKLLSGPGNYTTFKCKSKTSLDFIVGLEYQMDVQCYSGHFPSNDGNSYIIYWSININDVKEVTELDYS